MVEQPLFSIPGRGGILVEKGSLQLMAPLFFTYDPKPRLIPASDQASGRITGALLPGPLGANSAVTDQRLRARFQQRGNVINPPTP
jgi:hypothetical protein